MKLSKEEFDLLDKLLNHPELIMFLGSVVVVILSLLIVYEVVKSGKGQ